MVTINVCIGSACHLKGAYNVIQGLQRIIDDRDLSEKVIVKAAFCLGECTSAVSVKVNDGAIVSVNEKNIEEFFDQSILGRL